MENKKRIVIIGGCGVIGKIITPILSKKYEITIFDLPEILPKNDFEYSQVDVSNYKQLIENMPLHTDALINLVALPEKPALADSVEFVSMVNAYVVGSYNVLLAASQLKIKKVVLASTNHVTGFYEKDGKSILKRCITTFDYPMVDSVYGAMKLFAEQTGRLFSEQYGISVICLRIGTVVSDQIGFLLSNERSRRTLLSHADTVNIFGLAIETNKKYGVYNAVSNNPENPWDITKTIEDLGDFTELNTEELMKRGIK